MAVRSLGFIADPAVWWWLIALIVIFFIVWLLFRGETEGEAQPAPAPQPHPEPEREPEPAQEDDLKVIEGIGPKLEQVLKEAGIRTYRDLAAKTPEELQAILDAAGVARISNPQTWAEQAKLAADGDWEGLKALQGQLKGGVRRE